MTSTFVTHAYVLIFRKPRRIWRALILGPEPVSEAEFKALLRLGEKGGEIEPAERALIHRVFDFGARRASEVMTPRDRIFALDVDLPLPQLTAEIAHGHFSRVPLYRGKLDNIVGILHAKDLFDVTDAEEHAFELTRHVHPAHLVTEFKRAEELFREMRRRRDHMAIVVDEYGGTAGLVTIEDVIESLLGSIEDEYDEAPVSFVPVAALRCVQTYQMIPGKGQWLTATLERADKNLAPLIGALRQKHPGDTATLGVRRSGESLTIPVYFPAAARKPAAK